MSVARKQYIRALRSTNEALASPTEATRDETLAAILILCLHEGFATTDRRASSDNWTAHADGATALLKLRGTQQLETNTGLLLFLHVASIITMAAVQRQRSVPADFHRLVSKARELYGQSIYAWQLEFLDLSATFVKFRYDRAADAETKPEDSISKCLDIDRRLIDNMTHLASVSWGSYTVGETVKLSNGLSLHSFIYPDAKTASKWSSLRMMRLYLNETTHRILLTHDAITSDIIADRFGMSRRELLDSTERESLQMIKDICAGLLGFHQTASSNEKASTTADPSWVFWPLTIVSTSRFFSDEMRQWTIEMLESLGKNSGRAQALWVVDALRERSGDDGW